MLVRKFFLVVEIAALSFPDTDGAVTVVRHVASDLSPRADQSEAAKSQAILRARELAASESGKQFVVVESGPVVGVATTPIPLAIFPPAS